MAKHSLNELWELINQQASSIETLGIQLLKAKALLGIVLDANFLAHSESIKHAYFWVLDDIVEEASVLNEQCLDALLKNLPLNSRFHATME